MVSSWNDDKAPISATQLGRAGQLGRIYWTVLSRSMMSWSYWTHEKKRSIAATPAPKFWMHCTDLIELLKLVLGTVTSCVVALQRRWGKVGGSVRCAGVGKKAVKT